MFKLNIDDAKVIVKKYFNDELKFSFSVSDIKNSHLYLIENIKNTYQCLETIIQNKSIKHLIQNSIQDLDSKLKVLLKLIDRKDSFFDPNTKLIDDNSQIGIFEIDKDRDTFVENALNQMSVNLDMIKYQYLKQIAIELIMNTQIDAPLLANKNNQFLNIKKSLLVLEISEDKDLFSISTIDYFGSLDCYKLLNHISDSITKQYKDTIGKNAVGAGLGSALCFEHCDSVYLGVKKNNVTRVSYVVPFRVSGKKIFEVQKSIHVFDY